MRGPLRRDPFEVPGLLELRRDGQEVHALASAGERQACPIDGPAPLMGEVLGGKVHSDMLDVRRPDDKQRSEKAPFCIAHRCLRRSARAHRSLAEKETSARASRCDEERAGGQGLPQLSARAQPPRRPRARAAAVGRRPGCSNDDHGNGARPFRGLHRTALGSDEGAAGVLATEVSDVFTKRGRDRAHASRSLTR